MLRLLRIEYLFLLPLLLSAIFGLKSFTQKWPKQYRLFCFLVILAFLTEALAISWKWYLYNLWGEDYSRGNFWIYNLFINLRLGILLVIFYQVLSTRRIKKLIIIAGPMLVLFGITNYLFIQGPHQYNTFSVIFAHVPIILLCLCYFKQLLDEPTVIVLYKEPMVWIMLGTFLYHAVSLPFLVMLGFLNIDQASLALTFLPINDVLNIIMCICYLICFLCKPYLIQPR